MKVCGQIFPYVTELPQIPKTLKYRAKSVSPASSAVGEFRQEGNPTPIKPHISQ
jgi:hypothetical protein